MTDPVHRQGSETARRRRRVRAMSELRLSVEDAREEDRDRGIVRIDPADIAALDLNVGDVVTVVGAVNRDTITYTHARLMPAHPDDRGRSAIRMDDIQRSNAGIGTNDRVIVRKATARDAAFVALAPAEGADGARDQAPLSISSCGQALENVPLTAGDRVRVQMKSGTTRTFEIREVSPKGPVIVRHTTQLRIADQTSGRTAEPLAYSDIGGLDRELSLIREMIELPLRRPDLFDRLGIVPPRGVLLTGSPGSGKTLIARAVADQCNAHFITLNGPEIVDKFYGASEAQLRSIFETAKAKAPSIIFIDEIDAIAPKREDLGGDRQVERRIVAQILTLMDGLSGRGDVVVIAATNIPNTLDPALRRPGRFDREIAIPVPDRHGRRAILEVHTSPMPLADDVDLGDLAARTHGYVGADLAALAREAGVATLRRLTELGYGLDDIAVDQCEVIQEDFEQAMTGITPSAMREVFVESPDVRWSDIGGLAREKAMLVEAVEWPLKYGSLYDEAGLRPPKGILMHGRPGTGKTLLAKALAAEAQVNFLSVSGPQILSMYLGESERALRDIFRKARMAAPCIVFFDEIDALVPRRAGGASEGSATAERLVAQYLCEMDGLEDLRGVLVLGATNRLDRIDPALLRPGRFDLVVELGMPDARARESILGIHLGNRPLASDVDLGGLIELTSGMTGADIEGLCRTASLNALRDCLSRPDGHPEHFLIDQGHFDRAFEELTVLDNGQGEID